MNENNRNLIPTAINQQVAVGRDSTFVDSISAVTQTDTFSVVPSECIITEADHSSNVLWINAGILVVVAVLAYIGYRQIKGLKACFQTLHKMIIEQNKVVESQNKYNEELRNRMVEIEHKASKLSSSTQAFAATRKDFKQTGLISGRNSSVSSKTVKPSTCIVRYATLQDPDANGVLRFAERSMSEEASEQKMFELELDTTTGIGTYHINHRAVSMLINDLQQLRDFVEPFTTNGKTSVQGIIDEKPGRIHQEGKFWIVDELAKIKIM